jgi:hypothetical protein
VPPLIDLRLDMSKQTGGVLHLVDQGGGRVLGKERRRRALGQSKITGKCCAAPSGRASKSLLNCIVDNYGVEHQRPSGAVATPPSFVLGGCPQPRAGTQRFTMPALFGSRLVFPVKERVACVVAWVMRQVSATASCSGGAVVMRILEAFASMGDPSRRPRTESERRPTANDGRSLELKR